MITEMLDMTKLTAGQVAAVDEIVRSDGWAIILAMIQNKIAAIEEELQGTGDPLRLLALMRTWQVFRAFHYGLQRGAQGFMDEMEIQRKMEGPEGEVMRQMYSMRPRFGHGTGS